MSPGRVQNPNAHYFERLLDVAKDFLRLQQMMVDNAGKRLEDLAAKQSEVMVKLTEAVTLVAQLQNDQKLDRAQAKEDRAVIAEHTGLFNRQRGAYVIATLTGSAVISLCVIFAPSIRRLWGQ